MLRSIKVIEINEDAAIFQAGDEFTLCLPWHRQDVEILHTSTSDSFFLSCTGFVYDERAVTRQTEWIQKRGTITDSDGNLLTIVDIVTVGRTFNEEFTSRHEVPFMWAWEAEDDVEEEPDDPTFGMKNSDFFDSSSWNRNR